MAKETKRSIEMLDVSALTPYENNARTHSDEQIEKICASIGEFGFVNPVIIDNENMIVAGHGRVMAAKRLGIEKVPCIRVTNLTETQVRAYILADNRLAEDAGWDDEILQRELQELKDNGFEISLTGFSIDDIPSEEIDFSDIDDKIEIAENNATKNPRAKKGKRYQLGKHVLMVGDSTKPKDVAELMQGERADLVVTDPPYNVALGQHNRPSENKVLHRRTDGLVIDNDNFENEEDFVAFLAKAFRNMKDALRDGGAFYIWASSYHIKSFIEAVEENKLEVREHLIWVKNIFAFGRQDYQWRHEPCLYGWKEGAAHYFIDDRTKTTVFEKILDVDALTEEEAKNILKKIYSEETPTTIVRANKPSRNDLHPTMKPVALMEKLIENSSKEGGWFSTYSAEAVRH